MAPKWQADENSPGEMPLFLAFCWRWEEKRTKRATRKGSKVSQEAKQEECHEEEEDEELEK